MSQSHTTTRTTRLSPLSPHPPNQRRYFYSWFLCETFNWSFLGSCQNLYKCHSMTSLGVCHKVSMVGWMKLTKNWSTSPVVTLQKFWDPSLVILKFQDPLSSLTYFPCQTRCCTQWNLFWRVKLKWLRLAGGIFDIYAINKYLYKILRKVLKKSWCNIHHMFMVHHLSCRSREFS